MMDLIKFRTADNLTGIVRDTSLLYASRPMYVTDQPQFLNGVLQIDTALPPMEFLAGLKKVEKSVGRVATFRYIHLHGMGCYTTIGGMSSETVHVRLIWTFFFTDKNQFTTEIHSQYHTRE